MDAFKSVDSKNLKKVYRSDGQGDWHRWRSGEGKNAAGTVKSNQYKRARHAPAFPKIGTNSAPDDASNLHVGAHDQVLIPENVARKKHRHWREELMEKEAEEKKQMQEQAQVAVSGKVSEVEENKAKPLVNAVNEDDNGKRLALPAGWHEMKEPDSGNVYYFNASTGETATSRPTLNTEPSFIDAKQFQGSKPGYVFHVGDAGLGYYKDRDHESVPNAATGEDSQKVKDKDKEPVRDVDPMIGTTLQPMDRAEPAPVVSSKKMKKKRAQYGETLMDVVTRSLSEYSAKHHPAILPQSQPKPRNNLAVNAGSPLPAAWLRRAVPPPRPPPIQWQVLRK